jgi:ADP-ribosylglycohydrolase
MNPKISISKYQACLLGGAIGDALGAPAEFLSAKQIQTKYGHRGITSYVEFSDGKGVFTDDTQMTLFTAEGLLRFGQGQKGISGNLNATAYDAYQRWLFTQDQPFSPDQAKNNGWLMKESDLYRRRAPGTTCLVSLRSNKPGTILEPINNSKGCGAVMRMAPVGLLNFGKAEEAFKIGCDLSALTHGHPSGYLSGGFLAALIADLATGVSLNTAIQHAIDILKSWKEHEETLNAVQGAVEMFNNTKKSKTISAEILEQLGSGWVAEEALSISLFSSLYYEKDFKKGLILSVNHSGDSDSTGAITGNILGLINGMESIPEKWLSNLNSHNIVMEIAGDLYTQALLEERPTDEKWRDKYPGN